MKAELSDVEGELDSGLQIPSIMFTLSPLAIYLARKI